MEGAYCFRTNYILEIANKWQILLMDQNFFPSIFFCILHFCILQYLRTKIFSNSQNLDVSLSFLPKGWPANS